MATSRISNALFIVLGLLFTIGTTSCHSDNQTNITNRISDYSHAGIYSVWPFDGNEAIRRQEETAKALGISKEMVANIDDKDTLRFVLIPAGKFVMGFQEKTEDKYNWSEEAMRHEVAISKPFYMGIYLVTRGQFAAFVADTGYKTDAENIGWVNPWDTTIMSPMLGLSWNNPGFDQDGNHPVVCISQNDARAYCEWATRKTKYIIRLPTEAEWEYACRAGTITVYPWGDDPDAGRGWCNAADQTAKKIIGDLPYQEYFNWDDGYAYTSPVGIFRPNAFGLYDIHGNAKQWCSDRWSRYSGLFQIDPQGPPSKGKGELAEYRMQRGSSWWSGPHFVNSFEREPVGQGVSDSATGFRVVCDIK